MDICSDGLCTILHDHNTLTIQYTWLIQPQGTPQLAVPLHVILSGHEPRLYSLRLCTCLCLWNVHLCHNFCERRYRFMTLSRYASVLRHKRRHRHWQFHYGLHFRLNLNFCFWIDSTHHSQLDLTPVLPIRVQSQCTHFFYKFTQLESHSSQASGIPT